MSLLYEHCDYCHEQMNCRNLYVTMRILEEEIHFSDREPLIQSFQQLKKEVLASGYAYSHGSSDCSLAQKNGAVLELLKRAAGLLNDLRQTLRLSSS